MRKHTNGYVTLILVIVISAVGLIVAGYLLYSSVSTGKTSLSVQQSEQAKSAANACSELALGLLQTNITLPTPVTSSYSIDATAKSSCSYTISGTSPNYIIDSSGIIDPTSANVIRKVHITLNQVGPVLNISSWQEQ